MFTCHQLNKYEYKIYENKNQTLLMLSGYEGYYQILTEAFQTLGFSVRFEDRFRPNYWDTYVNTVNEDTLQKIHCLLKIFKNHVFIEDALDQTFALDHHSQVGGGRSEIGELVYNSKPYKNPFTPTYQRNASELTEHYRIFIENHPSYNKADFIISIPAYKNNGSVLPAFIVEHLCKTLSIASGQNHIYKNRLTRSMKDLTEIEEKIENIAGAFDVTKDHPFKDRTVIIVDDLYDSGATLHELGTTLQRVGARVLGLVATKTKREM